MKKNKMMRLASGLLVAVLLTSSIVSGTFAKYVTSDSATDSARVAKWGVNVEVEGENAFSTAYGADNKTVAVDANDATVVTNGTGTVVKVVAPGTTGMLGSVTIEGKPEVDVTVEVVATVTLNGWTIKENGVDKFYCPIIFTNGTTTIDGTKFDDADSLKAAVEGLFNKSKRTVQTNTNLATNFDSTVTWEWKFGDSVGYATNQTDERDTKLGNLETAPTIQCTVTATVTQID